MLWIPFSINPLATETYVIAEWIGEIEALNISCKIAFWVNSTECHWL